jgi:hypothetical protein
VLRRIFGPKIVEITGCWKKLHNEELYKLKQDETMRPGGHRARTGERRNAYRILVGNHGGMRALGRPRLRWKCTKTDIKEMGCDDVQWIKLAYDRDQWRTVVSTVINLRAP